MQRLLPFDETGLLAVAGCYWSFEFEFGLRFVAAGGRKATLLPPTGGPSAGGDGRGLARQIPVSSSSSGGLGAHDREVQRACEPPMRVPLADWAYNAPRATATKVLVLRTGAALDSQVMGKLPAGSEAT